MILEQTNPWLLLEVSASLLPGSGNITFICLSFRFCIFKLGLMLKDTCYWVSLNDLSRWNSWVKDGNSCKQQECWGSAEGERALSLVLFWFLGTFFVRSFLCRGPNTILPASIPPCPERVHLPGKKGLCCPGVTAQHPDWKPLQPEMSSGLSVTPKFLYFLP